MVSLCRMFKYSTSFASTYYISTLQKTIGWLKALEIENFVVLKIILKEFPSPVLSIKSSFTSKTPVSQIFWDKRSSFFEFWLLTSESGLFVMGQLGQIHLEIWDKIWDFVGVLEDSNWLLLIIARKKTENDFLKNTLGESAFSGGEKFRRKESWRWRSRNARANASVRGLFPWFCL